MNMVDFLFFRNYIKKLIKQEIKQTDEHIGEITARLQHNIEEKQKKVSISLLPLLITTLPKNSFENIVGKGGNNGNQQ